MKPLSLLIVICLAGWPALAAQPQVQAAERGPHHTIWHWKTEEARPDGSKGTVQHSVIELASGLNYFSNGRWVPSKEEIEIFQGGATARQGQHQVLWPANLNNEAVTLMLPDGTRLRTRILGLVYMDAASGQHALVAETKDSIGEVTGNQVLYRDAFEGPFKADVRYSYTRAGTEQDVLIRSLPPSPADYGLDPNTTRLEVWTEFLSPPAPATKAKTLRQEPDPTVRGKMLMPDLIDQTIDFGSM